MREQTMPGGMKAYFVDAVAEAVVRAKLGRLLVGVEAERNRLRQAGQLAEREQFLGRRAGRFSLERIDERSVRREDVVVFERRWLVLDGVRRHGKAFRPNALRLLPLRPGACVRSAEASAWRQSATLRKQSRKKRDRRDGNRRFRSRRDRRAHRRASSRRSARRSTPDSAIRPR